MRKLFYLKSPKGEFEAKCEVLEDKRIKLLAGSRIKKEMNPRLNASKLVLEYRNDKNVVKDNIVQKDIVFNSPSTAAQFVNGRSTNGNIAWKDEEGKKIGEFVK